MFNDTTSELLYKNFTVYDPSIFTIIVYSCVEFIGLIGNIVILFVILCDKSMKTATNKYLSNLALADILILLFGSSIYILIPIENDLSCLINDYILEVSINVMIWTITVLSMERYAGICHPMLAFKYNSTSKSRANKAIVTIWILCLVIYLPRNLQSGVVHHVDDPSLVVCDSITEFGVNAWIKPFKTLFFSIIPMILITSMYVLSGLKLRKLVNQIKSNNNNANNSKQQAHKMLTVFLGVFIICWMPIVVIEILSYLKGFDLMFYFTEEFKDNVCFVINLLCYSSSLINPVIYNIMSTKFRRAFKDVLSRFRIFKKLFEHNKEEIDGRLP